MHAAFKCQWKTGASGLPVSFEHAPAATNVTLKKENQSITIKSLQFYENGEQITNKSHQDFTDMICFGFFHTVMFYKVIKYNICGLCKSLACIKYSIKGTCLVSVTFQSWITVYSQFFLKNIVIALLILTGLCLSFYYYYMSIIWQR